ncbi:hypothetical protein QQF64_014022 [Cirrhinus molitorella]|uniref:Uncharacterized protein n=1 Tax=Cirrhinus molitorella TaxID=172907 RepID=A0ABR3LV41_9TELE
MFISIQFSQSGRQIRLHPSSGYGSTCAFSGVCQGISMFGPFVHFCVDSDHTYMAFVTVCGEFCQAQHLTFVDK